MKHTKIGRLKFHLETMVSITKLQAAKYYHIYGLSEQINRLRSPTMRIDSIPTPNGNNSPFATYTLVR